jgi:hypothetical protein
VFALALVTSVVYLVQGFLYMRSGRMERMPKLAGLGLAQGMYLGQCIGTFGSFERLCVDFRSNVGQYVLRTWDSS